jgi:hypothetical protein
MVGIERSYIHVLNHGVAGNITAIKYETAKNCDCVLPRPSSHATATSHDGWHVWIIAIELKPVSMQGQLSHGSLRATKPVLPATLGTG